MLTLTKKWGTLLVTIFLFFLIPTLYAQSFEIDEHFDTIERWSGETYTLGSPASGWFEVDNQRFLKLNVSGGSKRRFVSAIYNEKIKTASSLDTLLWKFSFSHHFSVSNSLQLTNQSRLILGQNDLKNSASDSLLYLEISNRLRFILEINGKQEILKTFDTTFIAQQWYDLSIEVKEGNWSFSLDEQHIFILEDFPIPFTEYYTGLQSTFTSSSRGEHFYYDSFFHQIRYKEKDRTPPLVESYDLSALDTLSIYFDEPIKFDSCLGEVKINDELIENVNQVNSSQLIINSNFKIGSTYNINLAGFCDFNDNQLIDTTFSLFISDQFAPNIDTAIVLDEYLIDLLFTEETQNLSNETMLLLDQGDTIYAERLILSENMQECKLIVSSPLPKNTDIELIVQHLEDTLGNIGVASCIVHYDQRKPRIDNISLHSSQLLEITFDEKVLFESLDYNSIEIDGQQLVYDSIYFLTDQSFHIFYPKNTFQQDSIYHFTISGVKDISHNLMSRKKLTSKYDIIAPYIIGHSSNDSTLIIYWNEEVHSIDSLSEIEYDLSCPSNKTRIDRVDTDSLFFFNIKDGNGNNTSFQKVSITNTPLYNEAFCLSDSTIRILKMVPIDTSEIIISGFVIETMLDSEEWIDLQLDQKLKDNETVLLQLGTDVISVKYYGSIVDEIIGNNMYSLKISFDYPLNSTVPLHISSNNYTGKIIYKIQDDELLLFFETPLKENIEYQFFVQGAELCLGDKLHDLSIPFYKDTLPPHFVKGGWRDIYTLCLYFSENLKNAIDVNQFIFQNDIELETVEVKESVVELTFKKDYWDQSLSFSIQKGIEDIYGNSIINNEEINIDALPVITQHDLLFTEIFADPTPIIGLPESEAIEIYNTSSDTISLMTLLLVVSDDTIPLPFVDIYPEEYAVLVPSTKVEEWDDFPNIIGVANWNSLNNDGENVQLIQRKNHTVIDEFNYNYHSYNDEEKQGGGYSIERIDLSFFCDPKINWSSSKNELGGTLGAENSIFELIKDTIPPTIQSVSVIDSRTLRISFNEKVYMDSLENAIYYSVGNVDKYVSNCYFVDNYTLEIRENEDFPSGVLITINVDNFSDCFNNINFSNNADFVIKPKVNYQQLLVTELMIDHSPIIGLPESEYIEIYNNSDEYISIDKCTMLVDGDTIYLDEYWILPRKYLVLCPNSKVEYFDSLGVSVSGVSGWQTLRNNGGMIELINEDNSSIHNVEYSKEFYKDKSKSSGGWSIEMRDFESPCIGSHNWQASLNEKGGTPGQKNSIEEVVVDHQSPFVNYAIYEEEDSIVSVYFSELFFPTASFKIKIGGMEIDEDLIHTNGQILKIKTTLDFDSETLVVEGITDCSGNILSSSNEIPIIYKSGRSTLKISEILYDPSVHNTDFLELYYEGSNEYINLKNWSIARFDEGEVSEEVQLSQEDHYIFHSTFLVFTKEEDKLLDQYPSAERENIYSISLPSFINQEGGVALLYKGEIIEYFQYNDILHQSYLEDTEDISLERIDYTIASHQIHNWSSATESSGFATPTFINSRTKGRSNVSSEDLIHGLSFSSSIVTNNFDGENDHLLLENNTGQSVRILRLEVYDINGRLIYTWIHNYEIAHGDFLKWDGVDDTGRRVLGRYLVYLELKNYDGMVERYTKVLSVAPWN